MQYIITFILTFLIHPFVFANPTDSLHLPKGFKIETYAQLKNARSLTLGSKDIVFVGTDNGGKVYALVPNQNKIEVKVVAQDLTYPNGVAFYNGDLYIADVSKIYVLKNIEKHLNDPPQPIVLVNNLPSIQAHALRYIKIGPDKKLYIGIGAPCNICVKDDARFASIMRMNLDGSQQEIFAKGIRNTVGFTWDDSNKLWFTENGRDYLGDNSPPDEINITNQAGLNFGFPYCHGTNIKDPIYGKYDCKKFTPPIVLLQAHVAPLGIAFYQGKMFPAEYQHKFFVAEHGSWNRTKKVGYQVVVINPVTNSATPFITGWLNNETAWGRPVDVLEMRDGSLLVSDDYAQMIYRVTY